MISEKQLADHFDSFWQHHFPLLNPIFVRQFNSEAERLTRPNGQPVLPVPMGMGVERFDLAAELAFEIAQQRYQSTHVSPGDDKKPIERATSRMASIIGLEEIPAPSAAEITEAMSLAHVYDAFFKAISGNGHVTFRPRIKGAGILNEMEGDFCSTTTLFEVKAVNRKFQSTDLRQVVCYLVAGLGSRSFAWTEYCIFNPRLATVHSGEVGALLSYISGRTPHECIADVLDALMEREEPLETRF